MKRFIGLMMVMLIVLASFSIGVEAKNKQEIAIFADTIIGDSVAYFLPATYEGTRSGYATQYGGKILLNWNAAKFMACVDTLAAETADSFSCAIKMQVKNNVSRHWSKELTLTTLTTDSLYEMNIYDFPARFADEMVNADSVKFTLDCTDCDPTGNFLQFYIFVGEIGE